MPRLTSAAFARAAKVSRPAVTQAVRRGKLVVDAGLIDTDNPRNAAYLASSGGNRKPTRPPRRPPPAPPAAAPGAAAPPPDSAPLPEIDFGQIGPKERAEIRRINAQARASEAKLAREAGRVIERSRVQAALGRFGAALQDRLLTLGTRLGPKLEAVFDTGGRSAEIKATIDAEMADAIRAMKEAATHEGLTTDELIASRGAR